MRNDLAIFFFVTFKDCIGFHRIREMNPILKFNGKISGRSWKIFLIHFKIRRWHYFVSSLINSFLKILSVILKCNTKTKPIKCGKIVGLFQKYSSCFCDKVLWIFFYVIIFKNYGKMFSKSGKSQNYVCLLHNSNTENFIITPSLSWGIFWRLL